MVIINDGLSDDYTKEIMSYQSDNLNIDLYNISDSPYIDLFKGYFSRPVYWRLLVPHIVNNKTDKVLYMDADTLVRDDIEDVFNFDLKDNIVGACIDYLDKIHKAVNNYVELNLEKNSPYFNAGVLLIDVKKYLDNNIAERVFDIVYKNKDHLLAQGKWRQDDQYGLNVALYNNWLKLPIHYNYGSELDFNDDAKIVHFIGNGKPGGKTCCTEYSEEFFSYLHNRI